MTDTIIIIMIIQPGLIHTTHWCRRMLYYLLLYCLLLLLLLYYFLLYLLLFLLLQLFLLLFLLSNAVANITSSSQVIILRTTLFHYVASIRCVDSLRRFDAGIERRLTDIKTSPTIRSIRSKFTKFLALILLISPQLIKISPN